MIMKHFYMIYAEGHNAPTKKFDNRKAAECEARRIANKEKRVVFILSDNDTIRPITLKDRLEAFENAYKNLYGYYDEVVSQMGDKF